MELSRFRLPVLWIFGIFGGILFLHLIGVYIYEDGSPMGVSGGSINIGLVGEAPEVPNPLTYGQNKQTDLILSFLFRGLLKYDDRKGTYGGDIANCDISNLAKISCTLNPNNGNWSDGTKIQTDDVIATLQAFRANPPNEKMKAFLGGVAIVGNASTITLTSKEKNSLMLDLLTYPIVRSDMLERIRTGRLSKDLYITSGSYTFLGKEKNAELGYDRITIIKSEKNPGIGWLDKYHFLFFPNTSSLKQGAENLSIIVPGVGEEKMMLGPRFGAYEYALYEYIGFFINTDSVDKEIRKHIILQSETSLKGKVVTGERVIERLFGSSTGEVSLKIEKNFSDVMRTLGYTKPDEQLTLLDRETGVLTGASIVYPDNKYIELPSKKSIIYSEVADGNILISGRVPAGVKSVMVNDYTLKEYTPGNNRFSYKVSLADGTLIDGENTYNIIFETTNGTGVVDTLKLYYSRDEAKLNDMESKVASGFLEKLNTPELIKSRLDAVNVTKQKVQGLDPRYYYDKNGKPYSFRLVFTMEPGSISRYADAVGEAFLHLGVKADITPIDGKGLSEMLAKGKKDYDGIIVGFEANGRFSRVGQIFLSSEAKSGINFAKIESKNLDALFANLRTSSTEESSKSIQKDIQDYIEKEAFFLPISSPLHTLYIDKNLKGVKHIDTFQDITSLHTLIGEASIKEEYVLKLEGKGIGSFFHWLFSKI